jgi:hypothetical protein
VEKSRCTRYCTCRNERTAQAGLLHLAVMKQRHRERPFYDELKVIEAGLRLMAAGPKRQQAHEVEVIPPGR